MMDNFKVLFAFDIWIFKLSEFHHDFDDVTSHLIAFKLLNKALYSDNPKQIAWKLSIILYSHPKLSNDNTICTRLLEEREGKF